MSRTSFFYQIFATAAVVVITAFSAGCSNATSGISGSVTANGQPVTGGSLTFLPQAADNSQTPGSPASGVIGTDGKYKVEGAVAGSQRVSFSAPMVDPPGTIYKPGEGPKKSPYDGMKPKTETVEIKAGSNTVDIELIK